MVLGWIALGLGVLVLFYVGAVYNHFISLRNGIESTFNQISVALKKRLDAIGQLVDATKGQMKFEKSTLTDLTKLRSQAAGEISPEQAKEIDSKTAQILGGLRVQVENYPELRSTENVSKLMDSIDGVETEIARLRYTYNNVVQEFNTKRETIPSSIVAGLFGFSKKSYLKLPETTAQLNERPKIDLA